MSYLKLSGKVALVTGAGRGIGRSIAVRFAQEGSEMILVDVDNATVSEVARDIENKGRKTMAFTADVSNFSDVQDLVEKSIAGFGKIDVLVNNAALAPVKSFFEESRDSWNRICAVNMGGYFNCSLLVAKEMVKRREGKIINISSIAAERPTPNQVLYAASKGWTSTFTKALAIDLAPYKINVNAIAPGSTYTPWMKMVLSAENLESREKAIPMGGLSRPEDIAAAALFLASEEANRITATILTVDGGEVTVRWPRTQ